MGVEGVAAAAVESDVTRDWNYARKRWDLLRGWLWVGSMCF